MKKQKLLMFLGVMTLLVVLTAGLASAQLTEGLVELWELDNNYNAIVTAEHAGTLTTTGTGSGTFVGGKFGQGIKLDNSSGNQAYIVIGGDENDFDFAGGSMSISLWYTTESLYANWQALAAKGEGGGWRLHRHNNSGTNIYWTANGDIGADGALDEQDGSWHHVVATVDAVSGNTLYIDGVKVGTNDGAKNIEDRGNAMQIGGNPDSGGRGWDGILDDVAVWNRALSEEEVAMIWNGGAGASIGSLVFDGPEIVFPAYGEVVDAYPEPVKLEWINMDPNGADEVYVDVWFGTEISDDPNNPGDYEKIVSGQPISSYTITPPGPGIYYWQVDSYLNGDPAVITDPCAVEGRVYMFTNDGPIVSVDAGVDMITWSGEPVDLIADVNDDGGSALVYSWTTSDLPGGVSAVFDPSADVKDTAVKFTREPYFNANVPNASFENPVLADGVQNQNTPAGWTKSGFGGMWNPGPAGVGDEGFGGVAPDGDNVLWLNNGISASTVLKETFQEGANYTLKVDVGYNATWGTGAKYLVELLAGEGDDAAVIASDNNSQTIALDTFETSTVTYTYDVEDANKVGLPLQIRLACTSTDVQGTDAEFDNVVLTTDIPFPVAEGADSIDVTLTVKDETNPAVSDIMTIDVYEDACQASRLGFGLDTENPADFNKNCKTGIEDLLAMALDWLTDKSATGPIKK